MIKYSIAVFCVLFFSRCNSNKQKENEKVYFDYKKWVEIKIPYDTINSGEAFLVQCFFADTSYYSKYKAYPIVAFSEEHQINIKPKKIY